MSNFIWDDIKETFASRNGLGKIITFTAIAFLVSNLVDSFVSLAGGTPFFLDIFGLPAKGIDFLFRPWSIITYMFLHGGIIHLIFNMLWLHWMGKILSSYIGNNSFVSTYFVGGIAGGALYLIFYNVFAIIAPGNSALNIESTLIGGSAGVLAVVMATATLLPNNMINMMFIGPVKLKYIAIGAIVLTSLIDIENNTGGKIAHLGGALYGYAYVRKRQQGKEMGLWFIQLYDTLKGAFKPKSKLKVVHKTPRDDHDYNAQKANEQQQIDAILDKISKSGYESLSQQEKDFLFKVSNRK